MSDRTRDIVIYLFYTLEFMHRRTGAHGTAPHSTYEEKQNMFHFMFTFTLHLFVWYEFHAPMAPAGCHQAPSGTRIAHPPIFLAYRVLFNTKLKYKTRSRTPHVSRVLLAVSSSSPSSSCEFCQKMLNGKECENVAGNKEENNVCRMD